MVTLVITLASCFPDDFTDNGLVDNSLDASFTVAPDPASPNRFVLKANATNFIMSKWELGDGSPAFIGNHEQQIFLPDAGSYTIRHYAIGKGGSEASETMPLTVATSDPNAGNIVLGGTLDSQEDIDKWSILTISASGAAWTFADGKATITGGDWNQQALYQAISVVKGKTYNIDMTCASASGVSDTWFEVFCSTTAPVQGNDYSAGGALRNINTWDGCGGSPFNGKISVVGCNAEKNSGTFTAADDGVMYLVIKCGGAALNSGISVDNIEIRGQ